jgi:hypothetical protein
LAVSCGPSRGPAIAEPDQRGEDVKPALLTLAALLTSKNPIDRLTAHQI